VPTQRLGSGLPEPRLMALLAWLYETEISHWIRESVWGHPMLLCFHALGMAAVVGVVLVLSIRVAFGWPGSIAPQSFSGLLRVARWGFLANLASGVFLYMSNAPSLSLNWTFQSKIALIAAGGISILVLWRMVENTPASGGPDQAITVQTRVAAVLTIGFWLGAIVAGRYIAYTLKHVSV